MEKKKKKKKEQQPSQLHFGTAHVQGEDPAKACVQKRKNELGEQEALTGKKRKIKQATEIADDGNAKDMLARNAAHLREQHVISGAAEWKTGRNAGNQIHDIAMLAQSQEKKKKKKRKKKQTDEREHDLFSVDNAKNAMHDSDEDDMLFNFSTEPNVDIVDHRSTQKAETFLATDQIVKSKKKKKKSVKGEHDSVLSDHQNEAACRTPGNDTVYNVATQPAVTNTVDYNGPAAANKHANGSFQNENTEVFIEQKGLQEKEKRKMKAVDEGTQERNQSARMSTESATSRPTFSMAVAGSIVDNAQSLELATMLAGQIARAATIFRVDEIVVFDDYAGPSSSDYQAILQESNCEEVGGVFMVRILQYLEMPQYLRKALIPMHRSLGSVGKLPPLDAPHHLRRHEWRPFREGVVLDKRPLSGSGSCVDVGLDKEVVVSQKLKSGMRVTVAMGHTKADGNVLQVVDRETARQEGFYWGYRVRYASCLSAVFDECPFEGKYDYCIGTSEHGEKLGPTDLVLPKCRHLLVAFGGLSGLEESVETDKKLQNRKVTSLFDRYINTCPNQGSRTIRTEEAILISLQFLQAAVQQALSAL